MKKLYLIPTIKIYQHCPLDLMTGTHLIDQDDNQTDTGLPGGVPGDNPGTGGPTAKGGLWDVDSEGSGW